jgi:hypothetical protein
MYEHSTPIRTKKQTIANPSRASRAEPQRIPTPAYLLELAERLELEARRALLVAEQLRLEALQLRLEEQGALL